MKKLFLFVLSIFIFAGCGNNDANSLSETEEGSDNELTLSDAQLQQIGYTSTALQSFSLTEILRLNGTVDVPPQNLISVSSAFGGYIKSTEMLPGSHFDKGDILAVMEDEKYILMQEEYLKTKTLLELTRAEYERQQELNKTKAGSDKALQQAKAAYETHQITLAALAQKLEMLNLNPDTITSGTISRTINIYAPFEGYITGVFVNVGKYISPSEVLFELVDPSDLHIHLKAFEQDWTKLANGMRFTAYTNILPDKKHPGEIIQVGRNISDSKTAEIHGHFDVDDPTLIPGMYVTAEVETVREDAPGLPEESVLSFEGNTYVLLETEHGQFRLTPVKAGRSSGGFTEILNPEILENKTIVQKGAYAMLMALKNEPEED